MSPEELVENEGKRVIRLLEGADQDILKAYIVQMESRAADRVRFRANLKERMLQLAQTCAWGALIVVAVGLLGPWFYGAGLSCNEAKQADVVIAEALVESARYVQETKQENEKLKTLCLEAITCKCD